MPWNKDDEGGGKGPWGQGPSDNSRNKNNWGGGGNRGPGSNLPPDLDELVRRGKDGLKGVLPGGGSGRGGWIVPLVLAAAFVAFNSVYQVQPDERGVVMRLGKYNRTAEPGLHFALWPVEKMEKPKTGSVRQIDIGVANDEATMLTSDKNIISVPFSVFWQITDAKSYLYNVADPEELIRVISQSAMREVVGQTKAQPLLTNGKDLVAAEMTQIAQKLLDEYQSGVRVTAVNLGDVQPPAEVAEAFAEVVRAGQDLERLGNEADQYKNQQLRLAEGEAAKLIEDANGYKASVVADAQGEAARFVSVYDQYKNAKDVTRQRIFIETMEQILAKTNKIVMQGGKDGSGILPYLPLPEIKNREPDTTIDTGAKP
jgi:modulator of FtsH protease HflK